jgi:hypothetical protein
MFQIQIQICKITGGVIGAVEYEGAYSKEDFTLQDYDFNAAPEGTLSPQPRQADTDDHTTMVVGNRKYQCIPVPAKILQIGRHADNHIVPFDQTFPRFAMRVCLYETGGGSHYLKIKAAGYGTDESGAMVMKLTEKATPLNDRTDFSTSNPVLVFTGSSPPEVGDDVRDRHAAIVSVKGYTYSINAPHTSRNYRNVVDVANPVIGVGCGEIYVRIGLKV